MSETFLSTKKLAQKLKGIKDPEDLLEGLNNLLSTYPQDSLRILLPIFQKQFIKITKGMSNGEINAFVGEYPEAYKSLGIPESKKVNDPDKLNLWPTIATGAGAASGAATLFGIERALRNNPKFRAGMVSPLKRGGGALGGSVLGATFTNLINKATGEHLSDETATGLGAGIGGTASAMYVGDLENLGRKYFEDRKTRLAEEARLAEEVRAKREAEEVRAKREAKQVKANTPRDKVSSDLQYNKNIEKAKHNKLLPVVVKSKTQGDTKAKLNLGLQGKTTQGFWKGGNKVGIGRSLGYLGWIPLLATVLGGAQKTQLDPNYSILNPKNRDAATGKLDYQAWYKQILLDVAEALNPLPIPLGSWGAEPKPIDDSYHSDVYKDPPESKAAYGRNLKR